MTKEWAVGLHAARLGSRDLEVCAGDPNLGEVRGPGFDDRLGRRRRGDGPCDHRAGVERCARRFGSIRRDPTSPIHNARR